MEENNGNKLNEYILRFSSKEKNSLGAIRNTKDILVAEDGDLLWLRGLPYTEVLPLKIRQLPILNSYLINSENLLFAPGKVTPSGRLKEMTWIPLTEFITAELPVAALSGHTEQKLALRIVPSFCEETSTALLTDLKSWKAYIEYAPEARFQNLVFAVSENGDVLIMGTPLSPIPGKEYWCRQSVLLPAGFDFNYFFMMDSILQKLNPLGEYYILFYPDSTWSKIPLEAFQKVTRSAVRNTQ